MASKKYLEAAQLLLKVADIAINVIQSQTPEDTKTDAAGKQQMIKAYIGFKDSLLNASPALQTMICLQGIKTSILRKDMMRLLIFSGKK